MKTTNYAEKFLKLDEEFEKEDQKFTAFNFGVYQSSMTYKIKIKNAASALLKLQKELNEENYKNAVDAVKEVKKCQSIAKKELNEKKQAVKEANELLKTVERNDYNKTPYDEARKILDNVNYSVANEFTLSTVIQLINDCKRLDDSALKISELKSYDSDDKIHEVAQKIKKSRAEDMAKSRAKADFLRDVRLTPKANEQLSRLCEHLALNKTQVINKLLEEQEQLKLL